MKKKLISSASPYEKSIGFSRAVRIGNIIAVSGTGPIADDGTTAFPNQAYEQAKRCLEIIEKAIKEAGGTIDDVFRTRIYVTDISLMEEVGRAHAEFFATIRPASTMVEVRALARDDWVVEIEAEAMV